MRIKNIVKRYLPKSLMPFAVFCYLKFKFKVKPQMDKSSTERSILNAVIAYNNYGGYCIPRESIHRPAAQAIMRGEIWEPETIKCIIDNCLDGDIVHAGTYFGDFLPKLSISISSNAKIWAFEPNPVNFKCAEITILLNYLKNISLINAGLGEMTGLATMQVADSKGLALGGGSTIVSKNFFNNLSKHIDVSTFKLDDVIPYDRFVSVIQLDVEGYEAQALKGAEGVISRCKPVLILEDVPASEWVKAKIFNKNNYIRIGTVHNNVIFKSI